MHIHPFPARMAPEIAMRIVQDLPEGSHVLDPMSGSGMVLQQCAKVGLRATGRDLDPLACLISRTATTKVDAEEIREGAEELISESRRLMNSNISLPWIDEDDETTRFVRYWFAPPQRKQLRCLSFLLFEEPIFENAKVVDAISVAVSRLIITKEPKASRARDTAHSRPHRTLDGNSFDVFENLNGSVEHVLRVLERNAIKRNSKVSLGDARLLSKITPGSIDAVVTSPPYLNAIDYMRAHKFSLVWLGHRLSDLQGIRSKAIGAEISLQETSKRFESVKKELQLNGLSGRFQAILARYYVDLRSQLAATKKVLRKGGVASYTIGNCNVRGVYVRNNALLRECAKDVGLTLVSERRRRIPDSRRYLPLAGQSGTSLGSRMRMEHILEFRK